MYTQNTPTYHKRQNPIVNERSNEKETRERAPFSVSTQMRHESTGDCRSEKTSLIYLYPRNPPNYSCSLTCVHMLMAGLRNMNKSQESDVRSLFTQNSRPPRALVTHPRPNASLGAVRASTGAGPVQKRTYAATAHRVSLQLNRYQKKRNDVLIVFLRFSLASFSLVRPMTAQAPLSRWAGAVRPPDSSLDLQHPNPAPRLH